MNSMEDFLLDYLPILVFMGIAVVIGLAFIFAAAFAAPSNPDPEKLSAYECGFNAFDDGLRPSAPLACSASGP